MGKGAGFDCQSEFCMGKMTDRTAIVTAQARASAERAGSAWIDTLVNNAALNHYVPRQDPDPCSRFLQVLQSR